MCTKQRLKHALHREIKKKDRQKKGGKQKGRNVFHKERVAQKSH